MFTGRTGARMLRFALPALLILLVLAGLRGATTLPGWSSRYHSDGVVAGAVLEGLLAVLLAAMLIRGRWAEPVGYVSARLHRLLKYLITGGLVVIPVVMLFSHFHPKPGPPPKIKQKASAGQQHLVKPGQWHFPLADILYGLLVALLVAAVVLCWIMARRRLGDGDDGDPDPDPGDEPAELGAAVASGRAALLRLDDARAAIIACYVAMESSLASAGAARGVADTPDELLARAVAAGLASVAAASRLTSLFYEARFSTHPLGPADRDEAERALTEIAASIERLRAGETVGAQG